MSIETRQICDTCGQTLGSFHKDCDGTFITQKRIVGEWETMSDTYDLPIGVMPNASEWNFFGADGHVHTVTISGKSNHP